MRSGRAVILAFIGISLRAAVGVGTLLVLGCKDSRGKPANREATFYKDVGPVVWKNCSACHRKGEAGPFELITYEQVKKHANQMVKVTGSRFMPPWLPEKGYGDFADERRLSDGEVEIISQWVKQGCVEGVADQAKAPQGWRDGSWAGPIWWRRCQCHTHW